ncbi:hypothetical protein K1T71_012077 [Dendrolimus kikuchii]|uniref:Uncharacterized protein n=1 Tax=Dendrolimus kikuchii TaxID=765133 RepID=A0ACC1CKZ2_9NEOP|nr:hypothetical protein K1T71_012077 [Dendrolimus kikuchii]
MSDWYWKVIALKTAFALSFLVCSLRADETVQKLPFCNPSLNKDGAAPNDLVIISTLDGKISAFSTQNGIKAWDLETQPLLSSNLHHVELTSGGKWVRLVPSLRGTLYSLSGDSIEPLPFDAEQLLSSSFKYSEDMVIAGARETHWLGLDASTGGVVYECGTTGCSGEQTAGQGRDLLVLRRHSNTVRALDPRTGNEKWNFSVAEHQLALSRRECTGGVNSGPASPVTVAVALHDGVVAIRSSGDKRLLWQQKLEAPVASMWRLQAGSLQNIDVLWEATQTLLNGGITQQPSLYIGVHEKQLYIQESRFYARKLETAVAAKPIPWKLVTARPMIGTAAGGADTALTVQEPDPNTLSLITLYGNTGPTGEHGFFLYLQETCDQAVQVTEDAIDADSIPNSNESSEQHSSHHIHVHVYSLWFWWKEVLLIAVSSALLMNLMIWPRFFAPKLRPPPPEPRQWSVSFQKHFEQPPIEPEYSGRYENDFTTLRCLGRGGFGVVFEAKNNIDHCSYAVKRIMLPRRHIFLYFNSWVEEPPPMWQQQRDQIWMRELDCVSVPMSDEYTATSPQLKTPPRGDSVMLNLQKSLDNRAGVSNLEKLSVAEPQRRTRSLSCNDSFSIVFDENASKTPKLTSHSSNSVTPNTLSKHPPTDEDSFIIFQNGDPNEISKALSQDISAAKKSTSFDKRLKRVKECDTFKSGSSCCKKKKGHTRHWSLDMVVSNSHPPPDPSTLNPGSQMYLYIQMQLCRRDSLHDWLRSNRTVEARGNHVKTLFSQIVSAVEYVHLVGLIHRDLKPSNILFAPDGRVKVGDFGLVTNMGDTSQDGDRLDEVDVYQRHTHKVGTHLYMSPEQKAGLPYNYKVDIYSLGLILFELLQPFGTESERVVSLLKLRDNNYPKHFLDKYPNETEVLKLMLSEDPSKRPTASGVRSRAPLYQQTDTNYHFILPPQTTAS